MSFACLSIAVLGFRTMLSTFDFRDDVRIPLLPVLVCMLTSVHSPVEPPHSATFQSAFVGSLRCNGVRAGSHVYMAGELVLYAIS
jgi:hypothetical protein